MAERPASVTSVSKVSTWRGWLWDSVDVSKEERRFLLKLDFTLLTFGTLGMLIKWASVAFAFLLGYPKYIKLTVGQIDTSNITNAFVSGMKEDLNLYQNQYNYIVLSWTIGYIIGQWPSNFILTRVPAHIWVPFLELGWTIFTFSLAGAKSYTHLLALRFVVGLFEAGYWPALYYILGSWYNKRELGKRNGILQSAVSIAPIFSGFLQAGIYNSLDGHLGLQGWRWLFIINGVISLPVAILAFFFLPDTPGTAKPNWVFTAREIELAKERMGKPLVYTIAQINEYPTISNAFICVYSLLTVWISDGPLKGRRWPTIIFGNLVAIVIFTLLVVTPVFGPFSHRAPLYIMSSIGGSAVPLTMAWMTELISDNAEQRAFTAAAMNTLQYSMSAWIPLVWFQQIHQPNVTSGNRAAAVVASFNIAVYIAIAVLAHREKLQKKRNGALAPTSSIDDPESSSIGEGNEKKIPAFQSITYSFKENIKLARI
ncbi:hypothetical protein VTL71DRAFT_14907 [Oculimacula yallundae]|uniref:Major facilitator superfamily (MFS) profile domain-containing protein n=1 Tax=Oculimacula yallundae TaxID=86028 RepID=A0ABR4CF50_9HELO